MKKAISVACISMCSTDNYVRNVETALSIVKKACEDGAEWIVLPEVFTYIGNASGLNSFSEDLNSSLILKLSVLAEKYKCVIFCGSFPERIDGSNKVFNTMIVLNREGNKQAIYRKVHLFSLFNEDGTPILNEGDNFESGSHLITTKIDGWNVGLSICYDLRFPDFFTALSKDSPLDAIVLPAAFTFETGRSHWEILLRARAIENQCFMLAANQVGHHSSTRQSYGHSMVINPWGSVLSNTREKEGYILTQIDPLDLIKSRSKVPSIQNRRPKVYTSTLNQD